jgi:hypothetical protein
MSETTRARPRYDDMASRLAVRYADIRLVREHRDGHLVDLKSGLTMLVTATVARRYVPEVDDAEPEAVEPEPAENPVKAAPKPTRTGKASQ